MKLALGLFLMVLVAAGNVASSDNKSDVSQYEVAKKVEVEPGVFVEKGKNGFRRITNRNTGEITITIDGEIIEPIVDPISNCTPCQSDGIDLTSRDETLPISSPAAEVDGVCATAGSDLDTILYWSEVSNLDSTLFVGPFHYNRFDAYIELNFLDSNLLAICDFLERADDRVAVQESMTGWSSERWFGVKWRVFIWGSGAACYGGNASPTQSNIVLSDPMYRIGCNKPYYDNGIAYYDNPNDLGDWWPYFSLFLHEHLHAVNPYPIFSRRWLTEGWSTYYEYNSLVSSGDINRETADTYIRLGYPGGWQWDEYIANDYRDGSDKSLQSSAGYNIVGWMLCKMRDEKGFDWETFYDMLGNNKDALDRTFSLGPPFIYYTDAFVLYLFGRAMGHADYYAQTDPVFRYDGPAGPGWGARSIGSPYNSFDWFGDLSPEIVAWSEPSPGSGQSTTLTCRIHNLGA